MEQITKIKAIARKQTKIIQQLLYRYENLEGRLKEAEYKIKVLEKAKGLDKW